MILQQLKLTNIGQFKNLNINLNENCIIVGDNAAGKSTILESILYFSRLSSRKSEFIIRNGTKDFAAIEGVFLFNKDEYPKNIKLVTSIKDSYYTKRYFLNNIITPIKYINPFPSVVHFSPEIVSLLSGDSSDIRLYFLKYIRQLDNGFDEILNKYKAVLRNRNIMIRKIKDGFSIGDQLNFWDNKLIEYGKLFTNKVKYWFNEWSKYLNRITANYQIDLNICNINSFEDHINYNLSEDVKIGYTNIGPHLFEIDVFLDNVSLANFGSRGQLKIAMLYLIQSYSIMFFDKFHEYPLLLLDDIESELDSLSIDIVTKLLLNSKQQKLITSLPNKKSKIEKLFKYKTLNI